EARITRPTRMRSHCSEIVGKPRRGYIQLPTDQSIAVLAAIAQRAPDLTVGDLADRATILRSDPDRIVALFDDPRLVDQHHAIGGTERVGKQELMPSEQRSSSPGTLADEMLQVAHVDPLGQGDRFTGFARLLTQQAIQVDRSPIALFWASKRLSKVAVIGRQGTDKLLNIARCQVALWRRIWCWYNNGWHRYPFQLIWSLAEKDTMPNFAL